MDSNHWSSEFEALLKPAVDDAAKQVNAVVLSAALDLRNSVFRIAMDENTTIGQRTSIRESVRQQILKFYPHAKKLKVHVRLPYIYRFTPHLQISPTAKAMPKFDEIEEFWLNLTALASLQKAYDTVLAESTDFDFVVTFALGGVPAANYITEKEDRKDRRSSIDVDARLERLQRKYHVFPGLNWQTSGIDTKKDLIRWLTGLPKSSSVLFFDTGTEGNGPRQIHKLIKAYIQDDERVSISRVRVIGVVDGTSKDQKHQSEIVHVRSGEGVSLSIDYLRVKQVVTEDCQALLGYDSLRKFGLVQPVSTKAVLKITDVVSIFGANAAAPVLSHLLGKLNRIGRSDVGGSDLHRKIVTDFILSESRENEQLRLEKAAELGLTCRSADTRMQTKLATRRNKAKRRK